MEILKYFSWAEPQIKAVKALQHVSKPLIYFYLFVRLGPQFYFLYLYCAYMCQIINYNVKKILKLPA